MWEPQSPPYDPAEALAAAVCANDATQVAGVLDRHPGLRSKLDAPLPGAAFGGTALLGAVERRNRDMIDVLLRAGADINARSHWWAGSFGVLDGDHGLVDFLIERGARVDAHAAARHGRLATLEALVSAAAELVHARGGDGQTPLHVAASVEIAQYLLDHGADIDARDIDHESTPAQYMVRDRQEVARFLIARGCQTDILMAAAVGDVALVRKHLALDPSCIRMDVSDRYFPKRDRQSGGSIYIWTLGANKTAHIIAREFGHDEVFGVLMEQTPDELRLALACAVGDEDMVNALVATRPDLATSLSDGDRRRLAVAAQNNNTTAVRLMLAAGWPVDVRGQHGATALHWAAWHGNAEMVRELLRHRPALDAVAEEGHDAAPIGWAVHGSEHGWHRKTGDYKQTVEALLEAGAAPRESTWERGSDAVREVLRRHRGRK